MDYELDAFCEIDEYAVDSYCAIHNASYLKNIGNIMNYNIRSLPPSTMVCGGSPCQDFSIAGKGKGNVWKCGECGFEYNPLTVYYTRRHRCPKCGCNRIEGTRSSLVVYFLKAVRYVRPKFGLFENVKALTNKKHRETFDLFLKELGEYGYNTYWKVLNAKDYGIPQNRERVLVVFIRKDIDNGKFRFPEGFENRFCMLNMLEISVGKEYYLAEEFMKDFLWKGNDRKKCDLVQVGYVRDNADANRVYDSNGVARTIKAEAGGGGAKTGWYIVKEKELSVRKLTPKECFRLMGFDDADYEAVKATGISNTQMYKMCGNSIVVDMLYSVLNALRSVLPELFDGFYTCYRFSAV